MREVFDFPPLSDEAVVDKEAEDWTTLWQKTFQYTKPAFDSSPTSVGPLRKEGIW